MANIQSKKVVESNKKNLQLLHNKFGFKTILKLTGDKGKRKNIFKKAVKLVKNKLGDNIEEKDNSFIEKIILETITNIFELPIEALTQFSFVKKIAKTIWNKLIKKELKFIKRNLSRL